MTRFLAKTPWAVLCKPVAAVKLLSTTDDALAMSALHGAAVRGVTAAPEAVQQRREQRNNTPSTMMMRPHHESKAARNEVILPAAPRRRSEVPFSVSFEASRNSHRRCWPERRRLDLDNEVR